MRVMVNVNRALLLIVIVAVSGAVLGCSRLMELGSTADASPSPQALSGGDQFPDVLAVELRPAGDRMFDIAVTISSPYDSPQRYADGWRVLDPEGNVLGTHTLLHDHAGEQPFTRTQSGVLIPESVEFVTVEGRDQGNGFGGLTLTVEVPES